MPLIECSLRCPVCDPKRSHEALGRERERQVWIAGSANRRGSPPQVPPAVGVGRRDCGRCNGHETATPNQLTRVETSFADWSHKLLTPMGRNFSRAALRQTWNLFRRPLEADLCSHPRQTSRVDASDPGRDTTVSPRCVKSSSICERRAHYEQRAGALDQTSKFRSRSRGASRRDRRRFG